MKRIAITAMYLAALSLPFSMAAHDKKLHKGKATEGEITSVSNDRFEVKTAAGTVLVTFSPTTKFEHGDDVVDKSHLKAGEHVSIFGTKLPSGELVGKEILIGTPSSHEHGSTAAAAAHHSKSKQDQKPSTQP